MASILLYGTLLLSSALPALSSPLLADRAVCNRNYLDRCFGPTGTKATDVASRAAATAFCSSYLSIPVVTSVIDTTTPVTTTTTTSTTTDATSVILETSTVVDIEASTVTTTVPPEAPSPQTFDKRTSGVRVGTVAPPACLTSTTATSYLPSQVSAACACLSLTASTTYVTDTAAPSISVTVSIIEETTTTTSVTTTETTSTTTVLATTTAAAGPVCDGTLVYSNGRTFCRKPNTVISTTHWTYPGLKPSLDACLDLCTTTYASTCIAVNFYDQLVDSAASYCEILFDDEFGENADPGWEMARLVQ